MEIGNECLIYSNPLNSNSNEIVIFVEMEKITLTIKDKSKLHFLLELLKQFDFVEVQKKTSKAKRSLDRFAGIWSEDEATQMKEVIKDGCEQIHEEDW